MLKLVDSNENECYIILSDGIVAKRKEDVVYQRIRLPADVRKKEIREGAKEIFLKKGFNNTTMEDVIDRVGMSKGGVYRHYKNTSDMLYDLMIDGNDYRFDLSMEFISEHRELSEEELAIEVSIMKMLDKNDYKSLYAMFLVEAEKDEKLKKLRDLIFRDSVEEYMKFIEKNNLMQLKCLCNREFIAFMNSMMVACELLDVREDFFNHREFFRDLIFNYVEKHRNDEQRTVKGGK